jgi:signal peptidase II
MPVRAGGLRFGLPLGAIVLVADQLTKWLALTGLKPYAPEALMPFVNLTLAFNTGAAFSFLADAAGWQRWLLIGIALAVSLYLLVWLKGLGTGQRLEAAALGLILGGAVGNLIDRVRLGAVVDFIDLHYAGWHWPAFNIADAAIVAGVLLIILTAWQDGRRGR